jgi:hypothetical protein
MTPTDLLARLRAGGAHLWLTFDRSGTVTHLAGTLTDADRALLATQREALIALLLEEARAAVDATYDDAAALLRCPWPEGWTEENGNDLRRRKP